LKAQLKKKVIMYVYTDKMNVDYFLKVKPSLMLQNF